jgi:FixJ family two-component response regulator
MNYEEQNQATEGATLTPKILVVEDEESVRTLFIRLLVSAGYEPIPAENAEDALTLLDQDSVDLVLLDLHMPGPVSGEDLLFRLRDKGDQVPIVVISGWVDDEIASNKPDCVHAVLKKPVHAVSFIETVQQALQSK